MGEREIGLRVWPENTKPRLPFAGLAFLGGGGGAGGKTAQNGSPGDGMWVVLHGFIVIRID